MSTFEQLLDQAKVGLATNGLWLRKEDRNCEAVSRLFVAVRALIDNHAQSMVHSEVEKTKTARENSKLAANLADAERRIAELTKVAIRRGLESMPEISESSRDRVLTVNGG